MLMLAFALVSCGALEKLTDPGTGSGTATRVPDPEPVRRPEREDPDGAETDRPEPDSPAAEETDTLPTDLAPQIPEAFDPPSADQEPDASELPDFDSLIGLEFAGVERVLGTPDRTEESPPSRIWHYGDAACRLEVRFFPDLETLNYRVLSYRFKVQENEIDNEPEFSEDQCRAFLRERFRTIS